MALATARNAAISCRAAACGDFRHAPIYDQGNDPLLFEQESKTDGNKLAR